MKQLTIRNVTPDLEKALKEEKRRRDQSLNHVLLDLLRRALGLSEGNSYDNGLRDLAGTWDEAELVEFEKATALFEQLDQELWR